MREPSYVWGHFTKVHIDGELKVKCNHLDRHLKKCKANGIPSVSDSLQKTLNVMSKDDGTSCVETT